jgi:hypothetical protein
VRSAFIRVFAEKKLALAVSLKKILGEIMEVHLA